MSPIGSVWRITRINIYSCLPAAAKFRSSLAFEMGLNFRFRH